MVRIKRRVALTLMWLVQRIRVVWYQVLSTNVYEGKPSLGQPLQVAGTGRIRFGGGTRIGIFPSPSFLSSYAYIEARGKTAAVEIGDGVWINNGFCCVAESATISIGAGSIIGTNVEILDSDFHNIGAVSKTKQTRALPVSIGRRVFVGSNVRILKGVSIGDDAVIANSAVVVSSIPGKAIAAGIPARVIQKLD